MPLPISEPCQWKPRLLILLAQIALAGETTPKSSSEDALQDLARLGVFQECQATLKSIEKAHFTSKQTNGKNMKTFGRRLTWPFKERETKDTLQRLHHLRCLLTNKIELISVHAPCFPVLEVTNLLTIIKILSTIN